VRSWGLPDLMRLVLASGSPRRKRLLGWFGLEFETVDHGFDERTVKTKNTNDLVGSLALSKAYRAAEAIKGEALVIGSDLMVALRH